MTHNPRDELSSSASVSLPVSPRSSNEFDALIELLTTDAGPGSSRVKVPDGQMDLRDAHGQLDFSKIRNMFASPNIGGTEERNSPRLATSMRRDKILVGDEHSEIGHADHVDYPTPSIPLGMSAVPTLNLSQAFNVATPKAFDGDLPPAESTPIPAVRAPQGGNIAAASSSGAPWDIHLDRIEASPPSAPEVSESMTSSLTFLKQALDLAQQEIMSLRQRCRELEDAPSDDSQSKTRDKEMAGFDPCISSPSLSQTYGIKSHTNARSTPPPDVIHRALKMVRFVDELVWKRSLFGAEHDDPYGAENVQVLQERLELWEKVVRTRR